VRDRQRIATWAFFMMTAFRNTCGLSHGRFLHIARKYKLVPFLLDNYELLHYYDNDYVVNDVKKYIVEQGGNADELSGVG
jgi:hypothetical protein